MAFFAISKCSLSDTATRIVAEMKIAEVRTQKTMDDRAADEMRASLMASQVVIEFVMEQGARVGRDAATIKYVNVY